MQAAPHRPGRRGAGATGALVAVALHGAVVAGLARIPAERWTSRPPPTVELEVLEPPPPPPPPPEPEPEPSRPAPRPRPVVRALYKPPPAPPKETPPPPNQEPPPEPPRETAPPVFGVTLDSTVTGDSPVAVPVGNTLATRDRAPAKPGPPPAPLAAAENTGFSPVPEMYVDRIPVVVHEVKADYPEEARRLGVEGKVTLRVGIDRTGKVRSVRVVRRVGHGLDEAATQAMWKFKFTPARAKDGQAVDIVITYSYAFQAP